MEITLKIFESETHLVTVDYKTFKNHMDKWLIEHPHIWEDKRLNNMVVQHTQLNEPVIDVAALATKYKLSERINFKVIAFFREGTCRVFNKTSETYSENFEVKGYGYQIAELTGRGGVSLVADGVAFFRMETWIS